MKAQAWTRNPTRAFRHFQYSISEMLMSIFFDTKKKHASRVTLVTSVTHKLTEVKA
jgi:hypothetical protein